MDTTAKVTVTIRTIRTVVAIARLAKALFAKRVMLASV